ncbi:MAG TPA: hypothetical protein ENN91_00150 [Firmicutes bacterium]|nr:hypothetical protein [Bacillota bacterium]
MTGKPGDRKKTNTQKALEKKIHRALVEARAALHSGDEQAARDIARRIMREVAPYAFEASKKGGFNWVIKALEPIDELFLPDDPEE